MTSQVGIPPNNGGGPALVDQSWLNALAGGLNRKSISGLTAHAGGTQALAVQIPAGVELVRFTVTATNNDSGQLPQAKAGTIVAVYNGGAATLALYGKANSTGFDTINGTIGSTLYALTTKQAALFFCAADGHWAAIKSA